MNISTDLNAKEILFHLNYMGYRNVSKEQLKTFMIDLKKLIKYENNLVKNEVQIQAGPANVNIRRLFDSQNIGAPKQDVQQRKTVHEKRPKSANLQSKKSIQEINDPRNAFRIIHEENQTKSQTDNPQVPIKITPEIQPITDKENNQISDQSRKPQKSFIRPRSTSQTRKPKTKKTDPVALYKSYQKDWERFKPNMCESSHSDLRWSIREKMMGSARPT